MIDTVWMPVKFAKGFGKPGTSAYDAMLRKTYRISNAVS